MTEFQEILLLAVALYILECACWISSNAIVVTRKSFGLGSAKYAGNLLAGERGTPCLMHPLALPGRTFVCTPFPVSLGMRGVAGFASAASPSGLRPRQSHLFCAYDRSASLRVEGATLFVGAKPFADFRSRAYAVKTLAAIKTLAELPIEKRGDAISRLIAERLDSDVARATFERFLSFTRILQVLSVILVGGIVTIGLLLLLEIHKYTLIAGLLLIALALMVSIGVAHFRAHKRLYPDEPSFRVASAVGTALYPFRAMRAADALATHLFEAFEPITVAALFVSPVQLERIGGQALRDLKYPIQADAGNLEAEAARASEEFRERLCSASERFLTKQEVAIAERPDPRTAGVGVSSFCPRCLAVYTSDVGECADCAGVKVKAF